MTGQVTAYVSQIVTSSHVIGQVTFPRSRAGKGSCYEGRFVTIDGLTKFLSKWEDRGWINIKNTDFFRKVAYLLKKRSATTSFQWVKGHEGNQENEESDRLAKEGAEKELLDIMDLDIPIEYDLQGAKLSALTQAIAYKGIQERKPKYLRATTSENIQQAREAIHAHSGTLETDETIWKGIYSPAIRTKI